MMWLTRVILRCYCYMGVPVVVQHLYVWCYLTGISLVSVSIHVMLSDRHIITVCMSTTVTGTQGGSAPVVWNSIIHQPVFRWGLREGIDRDWEEDVSVDWRGYFSSSSRTESVSTCTSDPGNLYDEPPMFVWSMDNERHYNILIFVMLIWDSEVDEARHFWPVTIRSNNFPFPSFPFPHEYTIVQ